MSRFVDAQRREDALHARVEKAKARLLWMQDVVRLELDGLSEREMAQRLSVTRHRVALWRWELGLSTRIPRTTFDWVLAGAGRRPAYPGEKVESSHD